MHKIFAALNSFLLFNFTVENLGDPFYREGDGHSNNFGDGQGSGYGKGINNCLLSGEGFGDGDGSAGEELPKEIFYFKS